VFQPLPIPDLSQLFRQVRASDRSIEILYCFPLTFLVRDEDIAVAIALMY
jgi:hypothetical protein